MLRCVVFVGGVRNFVKSWLPLLCVVLGSCSLVLRCVAFVGGVQARGDDHKGERVGGGQSAPLLDDDGHHQHHHHHQH